MANRMAVDMAEGMAGSGCVDTDDHPESLPPALAGIGQKAGRIGA
jgi:hypothetical protein